MRTLHFLFSIVLAAAVTAACAPENLPGTEPDGLDVNLEIQAETTLAQDATTIEFKVIDGKSPRQSDIIILEGPAGQKFCRILSASATLVKVELYPGFKEGKHKVSVQRNLEVKVLGTTKISFAKLSDDDIRPEAGSTIYGKVSCNGEGLEGVAVSDGVQVVVTDRNGIYQLASDKKHGYVFISVPSGYEPPLDIAFPQFFKYTEKSRSAPERHDFELTASKDQSSFNLLVLGDIHLARRHDDLSQFPRLADDIKSLVSSRPGELFYGVTLGDMVHDQYWIPNNFGFLEFKNEMKRLSGLHVYQTIGNHDHSIAYDNEQEALIDYRRNLGPNYYSFNIGNVHLIALDNIECITDQEGLTVGSFNSHKYKVVIPDEQMQWLKKDLAHVSKDKIVFAFMHSTWHNNPGTKSYSSGFNLDNGEELHSLLNTYKETHVFSAHTHLMWNVKDENTYEHNAGAVCAAWWVSGYLSPGIHIAKDGAPGGYHIVKINGRNVSWQYKGIDLPLSTQFRTYDRNMIDLSPEKNVPNANAKHRAEYEESAKEWLTKGEANEVYINVWNADYDWTVEVKENGVALKVTRLKFTDPLYLHSALAKRQNSNDSSDGSHTYHMYKVVASSPDSTLDITVTDRFGNVYKETMKRPRPFSIEEYKTY